VPRLSSIRRDSYLVRDNRRKRRRVWFTSTRRHEAPGAFAYFSGLRAACAIPGSTRPAHHHRCRELTRYSAGCPGPCLQGLSARGVRPCGIRRPAGICRSIFAQNGGLRNTAARSLARGVINCRTDGRYESRALKSDEVSSGASWQRQPGRGLNREAVKLMEVGPGIDIAERSCPTPCGFFDLRLGSAAHHPLTHACSSIFIRFGHSVARIGDEGEQPSYLNPETDSRSRPR